MLLIPELRKQRKAIPEWGANLLCTVRPSTARSHSKVLAPPNFVITLIYLVGGTACLGSLNAKRKRTPESCPLASIHAEDQSQAVSLPARAFTCRATSPAQSGKLLSLTNVGLQKARIFIY